MQNLKASNARIVDLDGKPYTNIKDLYFGKKVIILDYDLNDRPVPEQVVTLLSGKDEKLIYTLNDNVGVVDYTSGEWRVIGYITDVPDLLPEDKRNPQRLIETVQHYINHIEERGYEPKDGEHYIYEEALKYLYGNNVFDWINKKLC